MICFKCSSEEFEIQEASVRQDFRGEKLDVKAPVSVCKSCGWQTLGEGQADELRKRTADAYRQQHNQLTSADIVRRRTARKMSQQAFAAFIGAGVASVKRWENGSVQEPIFDRIIRQKCDYDFISYALPESMASLSKACFAAIGQAQFSITTSLVDVITDYSAYQIRIPSNVSRLTSRVTSEGQLVAVSKEWRKRHSKTCDTDFIQCP